MYTIKEAAARAGVSVPLLRAWERRYGVVQPARTAAGYRLYDEASIERVRAMRRLVDAGWTPSQAAKQIEAEGIPADMDVSTVAGTDGPPAPTEIDGGRGVSADFVAAAAALDERRIETFLDDLFAGGSFERVVDDRLGPALRALGDAWAAGTLSVGAEHAASHAVLRRLSASFEAAGRASDARPVLVGLPPGSRHEIGALAFATAARRRGLAVVYLGADVPRRELDRGRCGRRWPARSSSGFPPQADVATAESVARTVTEAGGAVVVAIGGPGAADASVPPSVLRLMDGIGAAAEMLEDALARAGH